MPKKIFFRRGFKIIALVVLFLANKGNYADATPGWVLEIEAPERVLGVHIRQDKTCKISDDRWSDNIKHGASMELIKPESEQTEKEETQFLSKYKFSWSFKKIEEGTWNERLSADLESERYRVIEEKTNSNIIFPNHVPQELQTWINNFEILDYKTQKQNKEVNGYKFTIYGTP